MSRKILSRERSVYYACNGNPFYLFLLEQSLRSLRKFNRTIGVRIYFSEDLSKEFRLRFETLGAEIKKIKLPPWAPPTFLKWLALSHQKEQSVLYLDCDTLVFKDIERLFDANRVSDICARYELGSQLSSKIEMIGNFAIQPQIDYHLLDLFFQRHKTRRFPIFNSGVMLFNHGVHLRLEEALSFFKKYLNYFKKNPSLYPSRSKHMMDEVIASALLGRAGATFCGMSMSQSPWYTEWKAKIVPQRGIVMHTWNEYFLFALQDFKGKKALKNCPWPYSISSKYLESIEQIKAWHNEN